MKRKLITLLINLALFLTLPVARAADGGHVDSLYLDARAAFHQQLQEGRYSSHLLGEYFNLNMYGRLTDNLSYRIRYRFNKPSTTAADMVNAADYLYLNWQVNERWSFLAGKQVSMIGGYEYAAVPIDTYSLSRFCESMERAYAFGLSTTCKVAPHQDLTLQFINSPLTPGSENIYALNLGWTGRFAPWWHTIWSCNFIEDAACEVLNYVALGNRFTCGNLALELDLTNRCGMGQKKWLLSDYSAVANIVWSVGKWNLCAKAGYERNDSRNVDSKGRAYDSVLAPGSDYRYTCAGVEYFPLGSKTVRLHAMYYRDSSLRRDNFDVGITWRLDIIK